jgi:hypothetical protein
MPLGEKNLLNSNGSSGFPLRDILFGPKAKQFNHEIEESRKVCLSQEINDPLPNTAGNNLLQLVIKKCNQLAGGFNRLLSLFSFLKELICYKYT